MQVPRLSIFLMSWCWPCCSGLQSSRHAGETLCSVQLAKKSCPSCKLLKEAFGCIWQCDHFSPSALANVCDRLACDAWYRVPVAHTVMRPYNHTHPQKWAALKSSLGVSIFSAVDHHAPRKTASCWTLFKCLAFGRSTSNGFVGWTPSFFEMCQVPCVSLSSVSWAAVSNVHICLLTISWSSRLPHGAGPTMVIRPTWRNLDIFAFKELLRMLTSATGSLVRLDSLSQKNLFLCRPHLPHLQLLVSGLDSLSNKSSRSDLAAFGYGIWIESLACASVWNLVHGQLMKDRVINRASKTSTELVVPLRSSLGSVCWRCGTSKLRQPLLLVPPIVAAVGCSSHDYDFVQYPEGKGIKSSRLAG